MHVENWETDHIQHDLYVDISYKFTFACMYTNNYEHLHKWFGTFYRDSVLMKACIFNNHKSWSLSLFAWTASLIATCNFYFSDYVCTLLLQTIVVKVWLCTKTSANTHCCRSLNNKYLFSPITSTDLLFSLQHYLLPFHPLTTTDTPHR